MKWRKYCFSTNGADKIVIHLPEKEIRSFSFTHYKNQLKWVKDLHLRLEDKETWSKNIG